MIAGSGACSQEPWQSPANSYPAPKLKPWSARVRWSPPARDTICSNLAQAIPDGRAISGVTVVARLGSPFVAAPPPVHVRVARIAFWSAVLAVCASVALMLVALVVWVLAVDWQVLGL
jgi:hypothetical protein